VPVYYLEFRVIRGPGIRLSANRLRKSLYPASEFQGDP
jgi:hypothetical protein